MESWEPSSPQIVPFQQWNVDALRGKPLRRPPPWETDAWVPTSPQITAFQTWTVDPARGRANRRPLPWEEYVWTFKPVGAIVVYALTSTSVAAPEISTSASAPEISSSILNPEHDS